MHHYHGRHTGAFLLFLALRKHWEPVIEAEKSHLGLETGASGRRAASRTGWGGPWEGIILSVMFRDNQRTKGRVVRERA